MSLLLLFRQWFQVAVNAIQGSHVASATLEDAGVTSTDATQSGHLVAIALELAFASAIDAAQSAHLAAAQVVEEFGVQADAVHPPHLAALTLEAAHVASSDATQSPHVVDVALTTTSHDQSSFTGPWRGRIRPSIPEFRAQPAPRRIYVAVDGLQPGHVAALVLEATPAGRAQLAVDVTQRPHVAVLALHHSDEELLIALLEAA
jgi:hypothetical protein